MLARVPRHAQGGWWDLRLAIHVEGHRLREKIRSPVSYHLWGGVHRNGVNGAGERASRLQQQQREQPRRSLPRAPPARPQRLQPGGGRVGGHAGSLHGSHQRPERVEREDTFAVQSTVPAEFQRHDHVRSEPVRRQTKPAT